MKYYSVIIFSFIGERFVGGTYAVCAPQGTRDGHIYIGRDK